MNLLRSLELLEKETSAEVHLTGKYLRNVLRKKKHTEEIEVIVRHLNFKEVVKWLRKHGKVKYVKRGEPKVTFKTNGDSRVALIRPPIKGKSYNPNHGLKDDAFSRDFTFDSMFLPIRSKAVKTNIIDHFGGLNDIQNRRIRLVGKPKDKVVQEPIVMFRAMALSAELRYKIDSNLFYAIKVSAKEIGKADMEEVRKLFVEIVMSPKPSKQFKLMHDTGLLAFVLPELDVCYGVAQNKRYHKHDVFTHCILSCDNAELDLTLRLAALMHDVGKAPTREEHKGGKVTFYSHEVVSAKLTKKALRRLGFEKDVIKTVCSLVYLHMYNYEPEKWTDSAVRRFITKAGITKSDVDNLSEFPLFQLRKAERLSYGHNVHAVSLRQQQFEERIRSVLDQSVALTVNDLDVSGSDIMEAFNLKPGPTVGNILKHLLSVAIDDPEVNEKEQLITLAADYLSEALK